MFDIFFLKNVNNVSYLLKFHACDFSTQNIPMLPISLRMAYKFLHNLPPFYPNPVPHLLLLLSPSTAATLLFLDPSRHAPGSRPLHLLSPCLDPFLLPRMCLLGKDNPDILFRMGIPSESPYISSFLPLYFLYYLSPSTIIYDLL